MQESDNSGEFDVLSQYAIALSLAMLAEQGQISQMDSLLRIVQLKRAMNAGFKFDRLLLNERITGYYARRNMIDEQIDLRDYAMRQNLDGAPVIVRWMNEYHKALLLTRTGKYAASAAMVEKLRQTPSETSALDLLLLDIENTLFSGSPAKAETMLSAAQPKDDVRMFSLSLLKAQAERMKILANPGYADTGIAAYEKHMLQAVATLSAARRTGASNYRYDLLEKGLDFLIAVNMARSNNRKGLYYTELKKQIEMWQILTAGPVADAGQLARYSQLDDTAANETAADAMLKKNPALYLATALRVTPLLMFQKELSGDDIVLYVIRNENDLFVWTISPESISFKRIVDGYTAAAPLIDEYNGRLGMRGATADISQKFGLMFKDVLVPVVRKKRLIIIHDEATQRLPFEIISTAPASGSKNSLLLAEQCRIEYMPSITLGTGRFNDRAATVIIGGDRAVPAATSAIERAAIAGTGIRVAEYPADGPFLVYQGGVVHDAISGVFRSRNAPLQQVTQGRTMIFMSADGIQELSPNAVASAMYLSGCRAMLYAAPYSRDVNMGVYSAALTRGSERSGLAAAHAAAVAELRQEQRFSHPAYWAGLRLYLAGQAEKR